MILKALYDYYQAMVEQGNPEVAPFGMDWEEISCIVVIDKMGRFIRMEASEEKYLVPSRKTRTSGVVPYILWDKASYVLGIPEKNTLAEKQKAQRRREVFKEEVKKLYDQFPDNEGFRAVYLFYERKEYLKEKAQTSISEQKVKGVDYTSFRLKDVDNPNQLISSDDEAHKYRCSDLSNTVSVDACCLVTGKKERLARTHTGVDIGTKDKPPLISFQEKSGYDSYRKEQGANAPISEKASDAIRKGLNMLLKKGKNTNYTIGDMRFVFWSTLQEEDLLSSYKALTFLGLPLNEPEEGRKDVLPSSKKKSDRKKSPERNTSRLKEALKVARGYLGYVDRKHPDRFFILGLTPNRSRLSVKLWMEGTIREIVGNTLQHLDDMNIVSPKGLVDPEIPPLRPVYLIMKSISRAAKSSQWSNQMIQELIESIVKGLPYPIALQNACLERIRHERPQRNDSGSRSSPVTELRAALLKACFNRKNRRNKDIRQLTMALDPTNDSPAYLAGRLFSILEEVQKEAVGYEINSSIADRFFGRAANDPSLVFGELLVKANYHLRKLERSEYRSSYAKFARREIEAILVLLPNDLVSSQTSQQLQHGLDEESLFVVGYYHQRAERRRLKEEKEEKRKHNGISTEAKQRDSEDKVEELVDLGTLFTNE